MLFITIRFRKAESHTKKLNNRISCFIKSRVYEEMNPTEISTGLYLTEQQCKLLNVLNGRYAMTVVDAETEIIDRILKEAYDTIELRYLTLRKELGREPTSAEIRDSYVQRMIGKTHKVLDLVKFYTDNNQSLEKSTLNTYQVNITALLRKFLTAKYTPDMLVDRVEYSFIEELETWLLYEYRQGKIPMPIKPSSVKVYLSNIITIFAFAKEKKLITINPIEGFRHRATTRELAKMLANQNPDRRSISVPQLQFMEKNELPIDWLSIFHRTRKLIMYQRWTGMSYADLAKIGPQIRSFITRDLITGGEVIRYNRKKGNYPAVVPLFPETVKILEQLNYDITPPNYKNYCKYIKRIMIFYSIRVKDIAISHLGRHLFGSEMLRRGFSMEAISKMLGHTDTTMAQQVYSKVDINRIQTDLDNILRNESRKEERELKVAP